MMRATRKIFILALLACSFSLAQQPVRLDHPIRHVQGVVQRESGEAIPNIDVEVYGGRSLVAVAKTDSKGKFKTDSLEPGEYEVWFLYKSRPVFHDAQFKVTVDAKKGSKDPWIVVLKPL
jgi:Carboxypeptidase regulatory-like domain